MTIGEIISALGGAAGLGTLLWYAINLRSKKKVEKAAAEKAAAEADSKVSDNWQRFAEKIEKEYAELKDSFKILENRQMLVERALSDTTIQKRYAEYHLCTDLSCTDRKPPLGSFKTEDSINHLIKNENEDH